MRSARLLLLALIALAAHATDFDKSGNSMLNGTYYFRQVYWVIGYSDGSLSRSIAIYGNIKFDGNGNYTISSSENAKILDSSSGTGNFTATGTYSIAASGYGFMSSPYASGDTVYGLVGANGVFVGSSTDNQYGYNDMLIAAPVASPAPTASSFTGSWTLADVDLSSFSPSSALSMQIKMTPDGAGNLGTVNTTGYAGTSTSPFVQNNSGLKYTFSGGAGVLTFPNNGTLIAGQKYLYFSKDGNFAFGGAPNSFDMIVGVKTSSSTPLPSGLYYQVGLDDIGGELDTYFGSFNATGASAPQIFLGHERVNDQFASSTYDYTYSDSLSLQADGTFTNSFARYIVGTGGGVQITSGVGPYLGLSVALKAPTVTGTGVFLNPTGVVNSASSSPFTASIVPGELLTLYGSGLANKTQVASGAFPTTLAGVQVLIGGLPAPIYYVSATQISAIAPYAIPTGDVVQVQVNNNGNLSNIVTEFTGSTAPGVFTQTANGIGPGAITHLNGKLVTTANPAAIGETIAVYLTGLGAVSPTINDGDPGPSAEPLARATSTLTFDFNGVTAASLFAGLAPGYSGLYQLNVTVPSGIATGTAYLGISGPDSYMSYPLVPIGAATSSESAFDGVAVPALPAHLRKQGSATPRIGATTPLRKIGK